MGYKKSVYKTFALISQLGISMMIPVLMCTLAGVYLEEKSGIPLAVPLIILGILAGGRNVYILARRANEDPEDEKDEKDNTLAELITGIVLIGIAEQIVCLIFFENDLYNALGLWSGIAVAVGAAVHMKRSIEEALDFGEEGAVKQVRKSYAVRMITAFLVMGAVVCFDLGNPLTLLAGVVPLKISAYLQPHIHKVFLKIMK